MNRSDPSGLVCVDVGGQYEGTTYVPRWEGNTCGMSYESGGFGRPDFAWLSGSSPRGDVGVVAPRLYYAPDLYTRSQLKVDFTDQKQRLHTWTLVNATLAKASGPDVSPNPISAIYTLLRAESGLINDKGELLVYLHRLPICSRLLQVDTNTYVGPFWQCRAIHAIFISFDR